MRFHDYDDAPDLLVLETNVIRTARKQHACDACRGGYIAPGEPYQRWVVLEEGRFMIFRQCAFERSPEQYWHCPREQR